MKICDIGLRQPLPLGVSQFNIPLSYCPRGPTSTIDYQSATLFPVLSCRRPLQWARRAGQRKRIGHIDAANNNNRFDSPTLPLATALSPTPCASSPPSLDPTTSSTIRSPLASDVVQFVLFNATRDCPYQPVPNNRNILTLSHIPRITRSAHIARLVTRPRPLQSLSPLF